MIDRETFLHLPPNAQLREDGTGHVYRFVCRVGPEFIFVERTIVTPDLLGWMREYYASLHPECDPRTITDNDVRRAGFGRQMGEFTLQAVTPVHNSGDPQWAVLTHAKLTNNPDKWTLCT